jgi:uncharacterized membrane protein YbhN (UPF0104 family)
VETVSNLRIRSRLAVVGLLGAAMLSLLLAVPPLRGVLAQIGHLRPGYVVAALVLELASCASFVVVFRLFFPGLPRASARRLAWVEEGSGALLPGGGVGALAVGGWLLHRAGMSTSTILRRSSGLFLLTSATSVAVLVGAGVLLLTGAASGPHDLLRTGVPAFGAAAAAVAVLVWSRRARHSERGRIQDVGAGAGEALHALGHPHWRLLGALGYLGFDIAVLWATFAAVGRPVPAAALIVAYIVGYLANLIPIPGGVGVLEGGLAGALIAYGAQTTQAAAAVVVYHAIAFWIPSVGGLIAYSLLRRDFTTAPVPSVDVDAVRREGEVVSDVGRIVLLDKPGEPGVGRAVRVGIHGEVADDRARGERIGQLQSVHDHERPAAAPHRQREVVGHGSGD